MSEEETESEELEDDLDEDFLDDIDEKPSRKKRFVVIALFLLIIGGVVYYAFNIYLPSQLSNTLQVSKLPSKKVTPPSLSDEAVDSHPPVLDEGTPPVVEEKIEVQASLPSPSPTKEPEVVAFLEEVPDPPKVPKKLGMYTVQVGTYVQKESVDTAKRVLKKLGMDYIVTTAVAQLEFNQVLVGEFQHPDEVRDMVNKFFSEDIKVKFKILSEDGLYTLSIMSGFDKRKAEEIKKDLILKGYPARIKAKKQDVDVYIVKSGKYNGREDAEVAYDRLKKKGIQSLIRKVR